ncbi:MAG: GatB/YqeY domain-containing protein [Clostridia bacterium]
MKELLLQELKKSMISKDELRKNTITMLRAAILQVEKDTQKTLSLEDMQTIVAKEIKKRKESLPDYEKANRQDIVDSLKREIEILSKYLPEQLTDNDVRELVISSIAFVKATSQKDMGKVMQDLKPKTIGKADGKLVSDIVKELLSNK